MSNGRKSKSAGAAAGRSKSEPTATTMLLPELRRDQTAMALHPARMKVICAGRRFGKTMMAGSVALSCAQAGAAVAWIAPSYRNSRPLWRFAERMTAPVAGVVSVRKDERTVTFPSGGWLGIYSADSPDSIRGEAFDLVIVDEAARVTEETWTDAIQPTLADRAGRAMLISTPKGRNWFWREYMRGLSDGREVASFTAPSSANPNPNIRAAAERAKQTVSARTYRQEWLAEFVDDGGGVFRGVSACATATPQEQALPGHQYVIGADWARTTDYTVFCVVDCTTRELVAVDRFADVGYEMQVGRLLALAGRFNPDAIIAEENSMGGPLVERLYNMNMPVRGFVTTNASKAMVIEALALAFETSGCKILSDPVIVGELEAYEQERLPGGMMRYGAPQGMHDDTVMALALAWHGATQNAQVFV